MFCDDVAGRFIHHVPQDAPDAPYYAKVPVSVRDTTVDTIRRAGYSVDPELWIEDSYSCESCHEDGNCAASGKDGNRTTGQSPAGLVRPADRREDRRPHQLATRARAEALT